MDGRKLTRHEHMTVRAGFLDLMYLCQQAQLTPNEAQRARICAAWDLAKDAGEPSLHFFVRKPSPIVLPSSAGHVPRMRVPGVPGVTGS